MKRTLLGIFVVVLAVTFCACKGESEKEKSQKAVSGNTKVLKEVVYNFNNPPKFRKDGDLKFLNDKDEVVFEIEMETAKTMEEHARGLMYRPEMPENQGMLFIFDEERYQSFYMRNTIISLDIIYVNANKEIVDIYKETKTMDETSLPSAAPAQFVVEINAGLCDKYGIANGTKILF